MPYNISKDGTQLFGKQQLELGRQAFKRTDDNSEAMNINGVASGSFVVMWNGTGSEDLGSDWELEGKGTETTGSKYSGTNGLDTGVLTAGDSTRFDYESPFDVSGSYGELTFMMNVQAYPPDSRLKVLWADSTNTKLGSALKVEDYVSNMDTDEWKEVQIPIEDFNLTGSVQKLIFRYQEADGQHFYFDDMGLNALAVSGAPYTFRVKAPTGLIYHVERVVIVLAADDTGWNSDAFANITGGVNRGLLLRYKKIGDESEVYWKVNARNNVELFGLLQVINSIDYEGGDRQVVFALEPQLSSVILVDDDEVLDIVVRDDFSGLNNLRAFLHFGIETDPAISGSGGE